MRKKDKRQAADEKKQSIVGQEGKG